MRVITILLAGTVLASSAAAQAADALSFGKPPAWVVPQTVPAAKVTQAPVSMLLNDQQIALEPGKSTTYSHAAIRIENAQGLAAGNLSIVWQPATDTVTINKLQILRGDKTIDVLAGGQTFTVLRRETNLDAATLDGTLTATIQPEGLQVGDIIDFATTSERKDPVLKGHVESLFGAWDGLPIEAAHATVRWPSAMRLQVRATPNLPAAKKSSANGSNLFELSAQNVEPLVPPKGAPDRFKIGRLAEATDFASWSDVATLFMPLFREASAIPQSGPLHDEIEKIRAASPDPKKRAELALALVQDRVRYVALLMGQGGYVPASAESTWSRRFGDCKAKTALLLGALHSLGIEADPVLVQTRIGDMIADRLPMISLFNHVLVRAQIAGKDYWLDGTRTGDTNLDLIEVPDFGWGLPLVANAKLVRMVPAPLDVPNLERHISVDATNGVYAPAPATLDETYRGDTAVALNTVYSAMTAQQRDEAMREEAKSFLDQFSVTGSSFQFDKDKRELRISIKGNAKLNWKDGWLYVPTSSIAFDPDFDRPAGPLHDVPWAINHPRNVKDRATIRLPAGFAAGQKLSAPVHETLAGVQYTRSESLSGDTLTIDSSERSLVPEVAYKEALAAAPRLKALDSDDVYLQMPSSYRLSAAEIELRAADTPSTAAQYFTRGLQFLNSSELDRAIADFGHAIELDPKDAWSFSNRAIAYAHKGDSDAAHKDVAAAEAIDPTNPVAARARGLVAEEKGDFKAAIAAYTASLQRDPNAAWTLGRRASARYAAGDSDGALADSALALKANPRWIDMRVLRANIFMKQGKRDLVSAEAAAAIKDNPASDYAYVAAAKTYAALGQSDQAMEAFSRALAIKQYAYIYVNRAAVRPPSDYSGRMADLDAALKLEPDNPDALAAKARLLSNRKDYSGALAVLDRMKPDPKDFGAALERAIVLTKAGRTADAQKIFAEVRREMKSPGQLNNLCWNKATAGVMLESAVQDCRDALKPDPGNSQYQDSLGMALLKLGKLDEALEAYNRAIADNRRAASLMGRAFVYWRKGDRERAAEDAAAARKISPKIDEAFAAYGLKFDEPAAAPTAASPSSTRDQVGTTSPAPVPASSPGSGLLSNTSSIKPKALASSDSRNLSRSIAFSISSSGWPVYLA